MLRMHLASFTETLHCMESSMIESVGDGVRWDDLVSRWTIAALMLTNFFTIYVLVSHAPAGVTPTSPSLHYYPSITLLPFQFIVPSLRIATNLLLLICQRVSQPYCH